MPSNTPRSRLVEALKNRPACHTQHLAEKKEHATKLRSDPELLWFLLLQSAATLGNSRGAAGLIQNPDLLASVAYSKLVEIEPKDREAHLLCALRKAKVRWLTMKAPWLAKNIDLIEAMGGVKEATKKMLTLATREEKLKFTKSFHGIGDKYARNIWMDIYDCHFVDTVAIDSRLKKIACAIGFVGKRYCESEAMFQAVAKDAGLQAWELDRLLYGFTEHYSHAIAPRSAA